MANPSTNCHRSEPFELNYENQILAQRYFDLIESREIIKMTEEIAGKRQYPLFMELKLKVNYKL